MGGSKQRPIRSNPFGIEPALHRTTRTTQPAMTEGDVIKPTAQSDHGVTAASMSIYQN